MRRRAAMLWAAALCAAAFAGTARADAPAAVFGGFSVWLGDQATAADYLALSVLTK
jgi:hypothetical protein